MNSVLRSERGVSGHLADVYQRLCEEFGNVVFRWSWKGVPHVVVTTGVSTFSVCYFRGARVYGVFSPYPSAVQDRENLLDAQDVVRYIKDY